MKRVLAIASGLLLSTAAYAADMPTVQPPPPQHPWHQLTSGAPAADWSGFYLGVQGGWGWGSFRDDYTAFVHTVTGDVSGGLLGGVAGYNWQAGRWVLGVETDLAWANLSGSEPSPLPFYDSTNVDWFGTTRLRLGVPANNVLWFVSGGVAYGGVHRGDTGPGTPSSVSQDNTNVGWTVGAGADVALRDGWSLRGEYLYVDLGTSSFPATAGGFEVYDRNVNFSVIRAGLNKRF